jgi:hypothetical protein
LSAILVKRTVQPRFYVQTFPRLRLRLWTPTIFMIDLTFKSLSASIICSTLCFRSHVFKTFFKIFFLVVFFGLFHGLICLPVILSLIGPVGHGLTESNDKVTPVNPAKVNPEPSPKTPEAWTTGSDKK